MSVVDYVKTPFMACPTCGGDVGWETKSRHQPQCEDVTVAQLLGLGEEMDPLGSDRRRVAMVGDCTRCNYFIEVYVYADIIVDGEAELTPQRAITG